MPLFLQNRSAVEFVERHVPSLSECPKCMKRSHPNSARTFIDRYVAKLLKENPPARDTIVRIVDIGSGNLKQIATVVTSLVNAGYSVEVCLVDIYFADLYNDELLVSSKGREQLAQTNSILNAFKQLLLILNQQAGNNDAAKLVGVFSCIDSYLHTLKGDSPLQYIYVPPDQIQAHVQAGIKRRYIKPDLKVDTHQRQNAIYAREFYENRGLNKGIYPDLVLLIDDITEFYPLAVNPIDYVIENSDYAFRTEVLEPFQQINSATILATRKKREGWNEVLVFNNKNNYQPEIVYDSRTRISPALFQPEQQPVPEQKETRNINRAQISANACIVDSATSPNNSSLQQANERPLGRDLSLLIIGAFTSAIGIAAVAVALTVLNAVSLGIAGGVTILLGLGIFAVGAYKNRDFFAPYWEETNALFRRAW